jgi:hypothetical protein
LSVIHLTAKACYWSSIKCIQGCIRKAPTTISHVIDRLTKVCQIENQCFGSNTFHRSNQLTIHAISNCELTMGKNLTQKLTQIPVLMNRMTNSMARWFSKLQFLHSCWQWACNMQYSSISELWDDHEGGGSSREEEERNECEPEQVLDFMEAHVAYKTNTIPTSQWHKTHIFSPITTKHRVSFCIS